MTRQTVTLSVQAVPLRRLRRAIARYRRRAGEHGRRQRGKPPAFVTGWENIENRYLSPDRLALLPDTQGMRYGPMEFTDTGRMYPTARTDLAVARAAARGYFATAIAPSRGSQDRQRYGAFRPIGEIAFPKMTEERVNVSQPTPGEPGD